MFSISKLVWCSVIMLYVELVNADYVNSTMSSVRMIGDDFLDFQKTGKRVGGRDGRRLISFETKNDNIQVGLEFSIPFVSIPVKRSMDNMKSWASQTSAFVSDPVMNINAGAIGLTGAVVLGGFLTTYLWKSVMKDQTFFANPHSYPYGRHENDFDSENPVNRVMDKLDKVFHKYNIDVTNCVQKIICNTVRNAVENVAKGNGTSADKIFDGLSSTWLLRRLTAGTAVSDAISAGQRSADCEKKFFDCNIKSKNLQQMMDVLLRSIN